MNDIRKRIYSTYHSDFNSEQLRTGRSDMTSYFRWLDSKIGPFLADLPRDARILEVGCGTGDFLDYLKAGGFPDVRGVDCAPEQAEIARSRGHAVDTADVFDYLQSERDELDAVIALDFIEHLSLDESLVLLESLRKKLRPGGRIILQTPNGEGLFARHVIHGDLTHQTVFSPRSLRHLLTIAGFRNVRFAECGPAPKNLQGMVRVAIWKVIRTGANLIRMIEIGTGQEIWTENMICAADADR